MNNDFVCPPTAWVVLSISAGLITAFGLIVGLESAANRITTPEPSAKNLELIAPNR